MAKKKNFLFIITDQHRADHLGCAGNPVVRTPSIDSLAQRGIRFTNNYVANPVCMPNRASIMTGRMPASRAYQFGMVNRIHPREELEAEVTKIAAEIAQRPRFGLALCKQAINHVEEARGKRTTMDAVFHMHHLAHAHNQLVTGTISGGFDGKKMAAENKKQAGKA